MHRMDGPLWLGVAAIALLGVSLAGGWPALIPWALGLFGVEFVVSLYIAGGPPLLAAAISGSALLLMAEISYWSFDLQTRSDDEAGLNHRRLLAILVLFAGSLAVGALGAGAALLPVTGSLALTAVGVGAAAAALALAAALARRLAR